MNLNLSILEFPFDFELNGISFVSKLKGKLLYSAFQDQLMYFNDHIPFNVKGNGNIVFSVHAIHSGNRNNDHISSNL